MNYPGTNCPGTNCPGTQRSRRDFLRVGVAGGLGLSLAELLRYEAAGAVAGAPRAEAPAKSIIYLFLEGGIAQQESWDPKPYAPVENRGMFGSIPTQFPGIRVNELMPQTAKILDKLTVIRSMSHGENDHDRGVHIMFTGYDPSPVVRYPSFGSVVSHELGSRNQLPPFVNVPKQIGDPAGPGFLSAAYNGFSLGSNPEADNFEVGDLHLPSGVTRERFTRRRQMLDAVNAHFRKIQESDALAAMDSFYQRAYDLINSEKAREAFDLDKESAQTRDTYGRGEAGSRLLLARRLVEAGVRFISVQYGKWDHHAKIEPGIRKHVPEFDQGFAALINDLDQRGLLDSTLVVASTEFGRTPKINTVAGRDHWGKVFSIAMAGGGIQRGLVYGASDAIAAEPESDMLNVEDWASTMYHCLGIDSRKTLLAPGNRPVEIIRGGKVRRALLV
jgi:hypothetical protein